MMEDTDELAEFRKQWQDELLQWKGARKSLSNVELATELFLKGVASERRGTHYEGRVLAAIERSSKTSTDF
jgi:hypothetical protein